MIRILVDSEDDRAFVLAATEAGALTDLLMCPFVAAWDHGRLLPDAAGEDPSRHGAAELLSALARPGTPRPASSKSQRLTESPVCLILPLAYRRVRIFYLPDLGLREIIACHSA